MKEKDIVLSTVEPSVVLYFQLDEAKRLHSMQMEELEKRTSQLQMEADGLLKAQQALYVASYCYYLLLHRSSDPTSVTLLLLWRCSLSITPAVCKTFSESPTDV